MDILASGNIAHIFDSPAFSAFSKQEAAKIISHFTAKEYKKGRVIFDEGDSASHIFYVESGCVQLVKDKTVVDKVSRGLIGEEAAFDEENRFYRLKAIAEKNTSVFVLNTECLQPFFLENPCLQSQFSNSFIQHYSKNKAKAIPADKLTKEVPITTILGWICATIIPFLVYYTASYEHLSWAISSFLFIFSFVIIAWVFLLLPLFVPTIFAIVAIIILGLTPTTLVLSGFSSSSFFMLLSAFGLASMLNNSGLFYRISLLIMRVLPSSRFFYMLGFNLIGVFFALAIPSVMTRTKILLPLFKDIIESTGYRKNGNAITGLVLSTYFSLFSFSNIFLTGSLYNFLLLGLLPTQYKNQFTWLYWLKATVVIGGLLFLAGLIFSWILFFTRESVSVSKNLIKAQLAVLGKTNPKEWFAGISLIIFILFLVATSWHKVEPPWIGLALLFVLSSFGFVSKSEFQHNIDWPFLVYFGGVIGLIASLDYIGIDTLVLNHLTFITHYVNGNIYFFIMVIFITIAVLSLINFDIAIIIAFTFFLPMANILGINPWFIGFIILLASQIWFLPYQRPVYLLLRDHFNERGVMLYNENKFLTYNAIFNLFFYIAITFASVGYWKFLGIL